MEIQGTKTRGKITDNCQKCRNKDCGKLLYYDRASNSTIVICPYCGQKH